MNGRWHKALILVLAGAAALSMACNIEMASASSSEVVEETLPLTSGGVFHLDNVNGSVTLREWDREEVHVHAEKTAYGTTEDQARESLAKLKVEFSAVPGEVRVNTVFPKKKGFSLCCQKGGRVIYTVDLPKGTDVRVETVNGKVIADTGTCLLHVTSVNGRIDVAAAKALEAATVNGKVLFSAQSVHSVGTTNGAIEGTILGPQTSSADIGTVNGSVRITLGSELSAVIEGENVNGSVHCEIPGFTVKKHRLGGTWNGGGPSVLIDTVNGSITVSGS